MDVRERPVYICLQVLRVQIAEIALFFISYRAAITEIFSPLALSRRISITSASIIFVFGCKEPFGLFLLTFRTSSACRLFSEYVANSRFNGRLSGLIPFL